MFVRNLLQAGEYVTLVPNGIPVKLEYGDKGTLEKVYLGHNDGDDISKECIPVILKNKCVPLTVTIHKGQTFIYGVFKCTDKKYTNEGLLPDCCLDEMLSDFQSSPNSFKFYAGEVSSTAAVFKGAVPIRQWLTSSGFDLLSGYLVPANLTEESFLTMIKRDYVDYPIICSYIIFHRDGTSSHPELSIYQYIIGDVSDYTDEYGYVLRDVYSKQRYLKYTYSYTEAYLHDLHVGKRVFLMDDILYTDEVDDGYEHVSDIYVCKSCGRKLKIPRNARYKLICLDSQCNSVLYPRVKQLLKYLGLPIITYSKYQQISEDIGSMFSVLDVLDIDEFKDTTFHKSLYELARAIIPKSVLPGNKQVSDLCKACNNAAPTFAYYIQNPDKLDTDLGLDSHAYRMFRKWIQDPCNVSDIVSLICHDRVVIEESGKTFEGAPIFRGKKIAYTGKFFHGSSSDIESILRSYSAEIVYTVDNTVDCLIVGDLQEDVDGHKVMQAKKLGVPTFSEYKFFDKYEIDKDMAENL